MPHYRDYHPPYNAEPRDGYAIGRPFCSRGPWSGLVRVVGALCDDGTLRTATITGHPDSFFSQPARVTVRGRTVTGFVTVDDMLPINTTTAYTADGRAAIPMGVWRFHAAEYRKNGAMIVGNPSAVRARLASVGLISVSDSVDDQMAKWIAEGVFDYPSDKVA